MKAEEVFLAVLERSTPAEQKAYLDGVCAHDPHLRAQVEGLLRSHDEAGSFLEAPLFNQAATIDQASSAPLDMQIGPYKLLQQIGEGGMGVVYMAEQKEPVKRRVALKIIKPGMDTRQVIARFEAERQALAMMDHPNIARVLDAGTTGNERPFFVMELVKGVPITCYCDEQHLTPRERLELFIPVCQAVQHAHQKGVIHRDLKPSNVLVALVDGRPVPKVIDFGVAKATHQRLTEKTMFTEYGQIVGTLEYMSPEQARLDQLDIDTRSDVYSLGVLLYELLTGATPFDRQRLRSAAFDELLRIIREEEPPKPSTRLSTIETLPSVAANRRTEPQKLSLLLRGDLDWIVMKALEKDRARRYETANGFAADLQRYLDDEPVAACPPSAAYRFRKFARRNRVVLATGSLVIAALFAGVLLTTWQAVRATRAERLAQQRLLAEEVAHGQADASGWAAETARADAEMARDIEKQARQDAEAQQMRAEKNFDLAKSAVDAYLNKVTENELLRVPGMQKLREDLLMSALKFYEQFGKDEGFSHELLAEQASAQYRLGCIHRELGNMEAANAANGRAIQQYASLRAQGVSPLVVGLGLARAYFAAGRYTETECLCEEMLHADGTSAEVRALLADTYHELAAEADDSSNQAESLQYHERAFALRDALVREFPENPAYLAGLSGTLNNLSALLHLQGKSQEALSMNERANAYQQRACELVPHNILWGQWLTMGLDNIATLQWRLGQKEAALLTLQRRVAAHRTLVSNNPHVPRLRENLGKAQYDLAATLYQLGQNAEAGHQLRLARESLESVPRESAEQMVELAEVYAALTLPFPGESPDEATRSELQANADLAVDLLRKAVDAGYRNLESLKSGTLFDALRDRHDFQQLLENADRLTQASKLVAESQGFGETTLAARQEAARLVGEAMASQPNNLQHRLMYAQNLRSIGEIQAGLGQFAKAEQSLTESRDACKELATADGELAFSGCLGQIAAQIILAELYLYTQRGADARRLYDQCLQSLAALQQEHAGNSERIGQIVEQERRIYNTYGCLGLWPLLADYACENAQQRRAPVPLWALESTCVLPLVDQQPAFREFLRYLFQQQTGAGGRVWGAHETATLAFTSGLLESPDLPLDQMLAWTQLFYEKNPRVYWTRSLHALVQYRAGNFTETLQTLQAHGIAQVSGWSSNEGVTLLESFLYALVTKRLGQENEAHVRLAAAEELWEQVCRESTFTERVGLVSPLCPYWWNLAQAQILRREAWRDIAGQQADESWLHLIQARGFRSLGDTESSDAAMAAACPESGGAWQIWLARARLWELWNFPDQAASDAQRALELAGDNVTARMAIGRLYAKLGRLEQALPVFEAARNQLRDQQPADSVVILGLMNDLDAVYDGLEQWENSIRVRTEVTSHTMMQSEPDAKAIDWARYLLACDHLAALPRLANEAERNPTAAVSLARDATTIDMGRFRPVTLRNFGITQFLAGNAKEAVDAFEEAEAALDSKQASRLTSPYFYWAMALWRLGKHDLARQKYGQGISRLAERPCARNEYELRDTAEQLMGINPSERLRLALIYLNEAVAQAPEDDHLRFQRGAVQVAYGEPKDGLADLEQGVTRNPGDIHAWTMLIRVQGQSGNSAEVRKTMLRAVTAIQSATVQDSARVVDRVWRIAMAGQSALHVDESPTRFVEVALGPSLLHDREAFYQHAAWQLRIGDQESFEAAARKLRELPKRHVREKYLYARLASLSASQWLLAAELVAEGNGQLKEAEELPWHQYVRGMCLLRGGRYSEAIEQFRRCTIQYRHSPQADWIGEAIAHHHAGRPQMARIWLEKARVLCDREDFESWHPHDRIALEILLREAELLIEPDQAVRNAPYVFWEQSLEHP